VYFCLKFSHDYRSIEVWSKTDDTNHIGIIILKLREKIKVTGNSGRIVGKDRLKTRTYIVKRNITNRFALFLELF